MIDSKKLLADLRRLLKSLEDDLRARSAEQPALDASLRAEWQAAKSARRTGETYESWREEVITQAGVHWLLACVFLRFVEDNGLVERPWLAGRGERLALARDRHEAYFRAHPHDSDREYLIACFREAEALPALAALFDERHNPVFRLGISGDAAMALLAFWQKIDPDRGGLVHDFTDPAWNTRFLGDLYQDLSEAARKRYALLQTPEFVEAFILDRTLEPALAEFGYRELRVIDPTCGSGHFLLGAFARLLDVWARNEPARNVRDTVQRALDAVHGVDVNPFAVAIARFRLLVAALGACGVARLAAAPRFAFHLAAGDSLLHGRRFNELALGGGEDQAARRHGYVHAYAIEDLDEVNAILGRQYHAVVGNPPYITVKDAALNQAYRARYSSCHMKYSLGVPFTQRFFELAVAGEGARPAGFVGLITANSFMKREFGRKLVEEWLPTVDLTHVIDTSGAYIPGHGTPTVILFGRDRRPVGEAVRTVMGIKGEPSTPDDPAQGQVWRAILAQVDVAGSESAFASVADTPRATFARHPWSIGGGGAAELKELIEQERQPLSTLTDSIGFASFTGADEVFAATVAAFRRKRFPKESVRDFVVGDAVRDWVVSGGDATFVPYASDLSPIPLDSQAPWGKAMWSYRATLEGVVSFAGKTRKECGDLWWTWYRWVPGKYAGPLTITFGEVATHNHFVLDRGGKVFNRTAPVIKLPEGASEEAHLGLLGLLNSSVACFWLQQVCHNKGGPGGGSSKDEKWHDFYAFNGTKIAQFPLVEPQPTALARRLDQLAQDLVASLPDALVASGIPTRGTFDAARERAARIRREMIAAQEELDWRCYGLYELLANAPEYPNPPEVALGERAFEIVLARRLADGSAHTSWFEWLGITPRTEVPSHWPADYRAVVERRIALIESDRNIALIESQNCKRRWESEPWEKLEQRALRAWLLDRLEDARHWPAAPRVVSALRLADAVRADAEFMQVAGLHAGRADFDVAALVAELAAAEAVPLLPVLRYTESGLRKRAQWEQTWALQRREDAGEAVGDIPVPPKYQSKDFARTDFWRLRGGLDVPKERFVSLPHCERGADGSLPLMWAGWDHRQQATALASYFLDMKDNEGWEPARLQPLLAALAELVPWLRQWHNDYDPEHATRMGDYFAAFVADEARALGFTLDELRSWRPPRTVVRRGRRRAAPVAE
jgi:hypothetical protein